MGVRLPDDDSETTDGVRIAKIIAEGPAEKAGLKANDVIVELDEQKVSSLKGLLTILSRRAAGDTVTVKVLREGHDKTVELKLVTQ
jgi:S1-C subfamily serine protease